MSGNCQKHHGGWRLRYQRQPLLLRNFPWHRAILALDGLDFKKHSAVIAKFRELYIKPGIFDAVYSRMIGEAFDLRGDCDYEDFYLVTKQEVEDQIHNATDFLTAVQKYIEQRISAS